MVMAGATVSMKKSYGPTVVERPPALVETTLTVCLPSPVTGSFCVYVLPGASSDSC